MNAAELLKRYVALVRWEIDVAEPEGIASVTDAYPDPWRHWAEFFCGCWQAGYGDEATGGAPVVTDDGIGYRISAFETPEAVLIVDESRDHGCFRIPKKTGCETGPRTNANAAG